MNVLNAFKVNKKNQNDVMDDACFSKLGCHFLTIRDHAFSTYAKFSKNKHFLPHDTRTYVCVSGGKKC